MRYRICALAGALSLGVVTCERGASVDTESTTEPVVSEPAPWASRTTAGAGFPCDVDAVLAASCRRCHWKPRENDAPFSMTRWEELQEQSSGEPIFRLMQQMIEAGMMPPLDAAVTPSVAPLSSEQQAILVGWLGAGAPRAEAVCP